jgi:hypothetical protein
MSSGADVAAAALLLLLLGTWVLGAGLKEEEGEAGLAGGGVKLTLPSTSCPSTAAKAAAMLLAASEGVGPPRATPAASSRDMTLLVPELGAGEAGPAGAWAGLLAALLGSTWPPMARGPSRAAGAVGGWWRASTRHRRRQGHGLHRQVCMGN